MKNTIRIEGGSYTSLNSAAKHVARGKAVIVHRDEEDILVFKKDIRFFQTAVQTDCRISGTFEWKPRPSAGFMVLQAQHTNRN